MKNKPQTKTTRILLVYLVVTMVLCGLSFYLTYAQPEGASISGTPSVDTGPNKTPEFRQDPGGRIITMVLNLEQQNNAWKAYVGNVTGTYVLQNAYNYSIYEWPLGTSIEGEIYISRNESVNFTSGAITCATNAEMVAEQGTFGMGGSDTDSINNTFNSTNHTAFTAGPGNNLAQNTCPAIATWVNDTVQTPSPSAVFQEVALHDGTNFVYAALINNNQFGFNNGTQYDFQAIVAENRTSATGATYYFYVELGS